ADPLPGRQQPRVSNPRGLAQEATIISAEEPVASLAPLTTKQVMDDLARINRELHITMVVNVRSIELAKEYATRIIGLRDGEVIFDGSVSEATDEVFTQIYTKKEKQNLNMRVAE